jgi:hypothetical protein
MSASQRYLVLITCFLALVFDGVELGLMPVASLSVSKACSGLHSRRNSAVSGLRVSPPR